MSSPNSRLPILVIGSGAGGAVTALELATGGVQVFMIEEGPRRRIDEGSLSNSETIGQVYRRRGMNPIMGNCPIGFVEGCCLGGSTEINSGFWHRVPREILLRWSAQFELDSALEEDLCQDFEWAESRLAVGQVSGKLPTSTRLFRVGAEKMGWSSSEVPRVGMGPGGEAKNTMSRTLIPEAEEKGVQVITGCRVRLLMKKGNRITGVLAAMKADDGKEEIIRIDADQVFVCAGATETPALLQRSGIRLNVGNTFRVHPMLKVIARFTDRVDADMSPIPLMQVKEFWPDITMGGAYFSKGHLAMLLSDNWPSNFDKMEHLSSLGAYYVAIRGTGRGTVRSSILGKDRTSIRYNLSDADFRNLSAGFARLSTMLLAAGALELYPAVQTLPVIRTEVEAVRYLDQDLPRSALSLTTVHAFASCPMGERWDRCAADSFGKIHNFENLYINDGSMLPDSPGVNPQGTIMAFARRNVRKFLQVK